MIGFKKIIFRIIPLITLICFICLGITNTFSRFNEQTGQSEITYINRNTITNDNNTETTDNDTQVTYYTLDVNNYLQNLNVNTLKRSIEKVIDIETYQQTLNSFNNIWKNGYDIGDIIKTVGNGIILIVNTLILPINILLVPLRIISGVILTGFALVGIKTQSESIIQKSLNAIIDNLAIPLIQPIYNMDPESIIGTTWQFNDNLTYMAGSSFQGTYYEFTFNFKIPESNATYTKMVFFVNWAETKRTVQYYYIDENEQEQSLYVYDNNWLYENAKTFTIEDHEMNQNEYEYFMTWLDTEASQTR